MGKAAISAAPSAVVEADRARFGEMEVHTVIQWSGLHDLDPEVVRRYCVWFVGKGYGWKETRSEDWRQGYGSSALMACLGQHLGRRYDDQLRKVALHMA